MTEKSTNRKRLKRSTGSRRLEPNPLERIVREHAMQLQLCDTLEHIADGLPGRIDRKLIENAAEVLAHGMADHFQLEENTLFPLLLERAVGDAAMTAVIAQVEKEHDRDEDLAPELAEELMLVAETGKVRNADMLGYMLRGYFEALRRHIEWEEALIIPAARKLLNDRDLEEIAAQMADLQ